MEIFRSLHLDDNAIDVWAIQLIGNDEVTTTLFRVLDDVERARAGRFLASRDRLQFVQSHGIMRLILAGYLDCDPTSLTFQEGQFGKPRLCQVPSKRDLQFSLSHTDAYCMVAVRWLHPLGVDVERLRHVQEATNIARKQFTPAEYRMLSMLTGAEQQRAFFVLWTGKEACIKALGKGLTEGLDALELNIESEGFLRPVAWQGDQTIVRDWSVCRLDSPCGYVAAVSTLYPFQTLTQFDIFNEFTQRRCRKYSAEMIGGRRSW